MEDFILIGNNERLTIRAATYRMDRNSGQYEFYNTDGDLLGSINCHAWLGIMRASSLVPNS